MAKYSSPSIDFQIDSADGGSLTSAGVFVDYITKIGDVNITRPLIESTPFGASTAEYLLSVFKKYEPFTIEGYYDDTATTGPDAVLNIGKYTHSQTRSIKLTIGGTKTIEGEVWITEYKRTFTVGEYHGYTATLQPSGAMTEN